MAGHPSLLAELPLTGPPGQVMAETLGNSLVFEPVKTCEAVERELGDDTIQLFVKKL